MYMNFYLKQHIGVVVTQFMCIKCGYCEKM